MIEFTLNMPDTGIVNAPVARITILDTTNDFRVEAALLGHEGMDETHGISFNMEDSTTHYRFSHILLNKQGLDIETIIHEVRHAYFWNIASKTGAVSVNIHNELAEEGFAHRLDTLYNRTICTIEAQLGLTLKWKVL